MTAFDAKRDLVVDANDRLDALADRIAETAARLPGTEATLAGLPDERDVSAIHDNIDLARTHLQFAEESVDQGREAAALPADQRGPVDFKRHLAGELTRRALRTAAARATGGR